MFPTWNWSWQLKPNAPAVAPHPPPRPFPSMVLNKTCRLLLILSLLSYIIWNFVDEFLNIHFNFMCFCLDFSPQISSVYSNLQDLLPRPSCKGPDWLLKQSPRSHVDTWWSPDLITWSVSAVTWQSSLADHVVSTSYHMVYTYIFMTCKETT